VQFKVELIEYEGILWGTDTIRGYVHLTFNQDVDGLNPSELTMDFKDVTHFFRLEAA
jgi:hypothetical protein